MSAGSAQEAGDKAGTAMKPEVFDDFDAFVKQAVREAYDRNWKDKRGHFIAFLLASGQGASLAADSVRDGSGLRKAAMGAAGVVALRLALRYVLSGPFGVILTGAAAVSAASYLARHQKEISAKMGACKILVAEARTKFEETQGGYRAGRYDAAARNLMVQGLLKELMEKVDAA